MYAELLKAKPIRPPARLAVGIKQDSQDYHVVVAFICDGDQRVSYRMSPDEYDEFRQNILATFMNMELERI